MRDQFFSLILISLISGAATFGASPASLSSLVKQLESSDVSVRRGAVESLGKMGKDARPASAPILGALADEDVIVRSHAVWALGKIGEPENSVIKALIKALDDPEWPVRHNAGLTLAWAGEAATGELLQAIKSESERVRAYAARVLVQVAPTADHRSVPILGNGLSSSDDETRVISAGGLAAIGERALPVLDKLGPALKDKSDDVRFNITGLIGTLGPAAKVYTPGLLATLKEDKKELIRSVAAEALVRLDPSNESVIRELVSLLGSKGERLPAAAARALTQAGEAAVKPLSQVLARGEVAQRALAAEALGRIGKPAGEAVPELLKLTKDERWELRSQALIALGAIAGDDQKVLEALKSAMNDREETVRVHARAALEKAQNRGI